MAEAMSPEQVQSAMQTLLNGPAGQPPAGVVPNFANPPNLVTLNIAVVAIGLTITTLTVSARVFTKLSLIRSVAYEDCKPQDPVYETRDTTD